MVGSIIGRGQKPLLGILFLAFIVVLDRMLMRTMDPLSYPKEDEEDIGLETLPVGTWIEFC